MPVGVTPLCLARVRASGVSLRADVAMSRETPRGCLQEWYRWSADELANPCEAPGGEEQMRGFGWVPVMMQ